MTVARLGIDIDSSPAVTAKQQLDQLVPTAKAVEAAVESLSASAIQDLKAVTQNGFNALVTSSRAMLAELQKVGQQKVIPPNAVTEVEKASRAFQALKASIDPVYRAELELARASRVAENAMKTGAVTADEAAAAMRRYEAVVNQSLGRGGTAFDRYRNQIQNVSYQIQDLAVTGFGLVSFQQQLPQLLSGFGAMGAVLGTLAAVGIPLLGVAFANSGDDVVDFDEQLESLQKTMSEVTDTIELLGQSQTELQTRFAGTTDQVNSLVESIRQADLAKLGSEIAATGAAAFEQLSDYLDEAQGTVDRIGEGLNQSDAIRLMAQEIGLSEQQTRGLVQAMEDFNAAAGASERNAVIQQTREMIESWGTSIQALPLPLQEIYERIQAASVSISEATQQVDNLSTGVNGTENAVDGVIDRLVAMNLAINDAVDTVPLLAEQFEAAGAQLDAVRAQWAAAASDARNFSTATSQPQLPGGGLSTVDPSTGFDTFDRSSDTSDSFSTYGYDRGQSRRSSSGSRGGSRGSEKKSDLEREIEQVQKQTAALQAAAEAQAGINPLIDDYGLASETAAQKAKLLAAAQADGVKITPELGEKIYDLAQKYGQAAAASDMLKDAQDRARESAEQWGRLSQDVTRGVISDLLSGASAADAMANAIGRIGDRLIDIGLDAIFNGTGAPGSQGLGSILGQSIASAFTGARAGGGPVRSGGLYLVGEKGPELFSPGANGTIIPNGANLGSGGGAAVFAPVINAQGADAAAVARAMAALHGQFEQFKQTFRDNVQASNQSPRFRGAV